MYKGGETQRERKGGEGERERYNTVKWFNLDLGFINKSSMKF